MAARMIVRNIFLTLALIAGFFMTVPVFAQGQDEPEAPHVKIALVPETAQLFPGGSLYVVIRQDIEKGWHTYWKNPGDSGVPMSMNWTLPQGFEAGPLQWPVPERIDSGPLTNYGYEGQVSLLQEIKVPFDIPDGPVTLKARADLLVCKDICIPESHDVSVTLNDAAAADTDNGAQVNTALGSLPVSVPWDTTYREDDQGQFEMTITVMQPDLISSDGGNVKMDIIPYEWGVIDNTAHAHAAFLEDNKIRFTKKRGDRPLDKIGPFKTLVAYDVAAGGQGAIEVTAYPDQEWLRSLHNKDSVDNIPDESKMQPAPQPPAQKKTEKPSGTVTAPLDLPQIGFGRALLLALLGGLILNLMPCVFPVLSMKALSLVQMAEKSHAATRLHGLTYTAGVLTSFAAIAGLLIALHGAGAQIGWGFQLQNPLVVLLLAYLLFAVGLNLSGFYEISGSFTNVGAGLGQKEGTTESFFTGVLATIVATPCTAPFMGVAMGYALVQPAPVALMVFLSLGFGLALPYLALCLFPTLRKFLPRPGNWMVVFREFLAFPIYASACWLIWVYSMQASAAGLLYALSGMVGIGFTVWIFRCTAEKGTERWLLRGFAILVLISLISLAFAARMMEEELAVGPVRELAGEFWQPFEAEKFAAAEAGDKPLFVNMTASWCITCKVNERVALDTAQTRAVFKNNNVLAFKGDWTNQHPEITNFLERYGRNGVPLYVYYGPRDPQSGQRPVPVVLPQLLSPGIIAATVNTKQEDED